MPLQWDTILSGPQLSSDHWQHQRSPAAYRATYIYRLQDQNCRQLERTTVVGRGVFLSPNLRPPTKSAFCPETNVASSDLTEAWLRRGRRAETPAWRTDLVRPDAYPRPPSRMSLCVRVSAIMSARPRSRPLPTFLLMSAVIVVLFHRCSQRPTLTLLAYYHLSFRI